MVETLQQKELPEQQLGNKLGQRFGRQITPFFENPDGSVDKTKLNNKIKLKNSKIGTENNISLENETNKLNQIINEILDNPNISQKIKNEFAKQTNELLTDFYSSTSLDITLLKKSREFLSFGLEDKTNGEILQIVLNGYIDKIGQISSGIQRCSNDKTTNIKGQEYHKPSLDEFITQIKELEKTTGFKLQDFITDKIEKIDKEIFLSPSFWSQILGKNLISYLKQQRSTQENFETAYKGFESAYLKLYDSQITNYDQIKDNLKKGKIDIPENMENKYATKLEDMKGEDLVIMLHSLIMAFIPGYAGTQDLMNLASKYSVEGKKNTFFDKSFALAGLTAEASIIGGVGKKLIESPKAFKTLEKILKLVSEGKGGTILEKLMKTPKFQEIVELGLKHPKLEGILKQYGFDKKLAQIRGVEFSKIGIAGEKLTAAQMGANFESHMMGQIDKATSTLNTKLMGLETIKDGVESTKKRFFDLVETIRPGAPKDTITKFIKDYLATGDRDSLNKLTSHLTSVGKGADTMFELADGSKITGRDLGRKIIGLSSQLHDGLIFHKQQVGKIIGDINFARDKAQTLLLDGTIVENGLVQFNRFKTIFQKKDLRLQQPGQLQNEILMVELFHKYMLINTPIIRGNTKLMEEYRTGISGMIKSLEQLSLDNMLKNADKTKVNKLRQQFIELSTRI